MNQRAEPAEKKEPFQFTLAELLNFVFITALGVMLLTPTNRPEIELANCLIMILSAVLGALIGIFSSRARTSRRIIFMASGAMCGWLLTFYLTSVLSPPRYPEVSDRSRYVIVPMYAVAQRSGGDPNAIYSGRDPCTVYVVDYQTLPVPTLFKPTLYLFDSDWMPTQ